MNNPEFHLDVIYNKFHNSVPLGDVLQTLSILIKSTLINMQLKLTFIRGIVPFQFYKVVRKPFC